MKEKLKTMMVISLFLCLFKAVLVAGGGGNYGSGSGSDWNYGDGSLGPSNWSAIHHYCAGSSQSPVNIVTEDAMYNKALGTLQLQNYAATTNVSFLMENRNNDIQFVVQSESGQVPQALIFKGTTYRLFQFHFHWGSKDQGSEQGSEHIKYITRNIYNAQRFAGEMHIIHYNDKYDNVSQAISQGDGLLVWAHFLKVDSINKVACADFQRLLDNFGDAVNCCNKTKLTVSLMSLLPSKYDEFYHYNGSLTTPPCYESVTWIVNPNPILVSENQMKIFRTLKDAKMNISMGNNFRPVQPLNTRKVESNFDPSSDGSAGSAGVSTKLFSSMILTVIAVLAFAV